VTVWILVVLCRFEVVRLAVYQSEPAALKALEFAKKEESGTCVFTVAKTKVEGTK
jgi:hypothetical protein